MAETFSLGNLETTFSADLQQLQRVSRQAQTLLKKYSDIAEKRGRIKLSADTTKLRVNLTKAKAAFASFAAAGQAAMLGLRRGMAGASSALFNMKGLIVSMGLLFAGRAFFKFGANFEREMSIVKVVSRATAKEMEAFRGQVKMLGETTEFTATNAAEALRFLSMAGLSVTQSLAALPKTLDLATAGQIDLARAADISTNIMSQMGLVAADLTMVNDALVAVQANANTNIEEAATAFVFAGAKARSFGTDVVELSGLIGLLANNGIKASQAGTTLRQSMIKLIRPTSEGKAILREYNIQVQAADGSIRKFVDVLKDLADANLNPFQITELFGARAGNIELVLKQGSESIEGFIQKLREMKGIGEEAADTIRSDVQGSFMNLTSALQGVALDVWDTYKVKIKQTLDDATVFVRAYRETSVESFKAIAKQAGETIEAFQFSQDKFDVSGFELLGKTIRNEFRGLKAIETILSLIVIRYEQLVEIAKSYFHEERALNSELKTKTVAVFDRKVIAKRAAKVRADIMVQSSKASVAVQKHLPVFPGQEEASAEAGVRAQKQLDRSIRQAKEAEEAVDTAIREAQAPAVAKGKEHEAAVVAGAERLLELEDAAEKVKNELLDFDEAMIAAEKEIKKIGQTAKEGFDAAKKKAKADKEAAAVVKKRDEDIRKGFEQLPDVERITKRRAPVVIPSALPPDPKILATEKAKIAVASEAVKIEQALIADKKEFIKAQEAAIDALQETDLPSDTISQQREAIDAQIEAASRQIEVATERRAELENKILAAQEEIAAENEFAAKRAKEVVEERGRAQERVPGTVRVAVAESASAEEREKQAQAVVNIEKVKIKEATEALEGFRAELVATKQALIVSAKLPEGLVKQVVVSEQTKQVEVAESAAKAEQEKIDTAEAILSEKEKTISTERKAQDALNKLANAAQLVANQKEKEARTGAGRPTRIAQTPEEAIAAMAEKTEARKVQDRALKEEMGIKAEADEVQRGVLSKGMEDELEARRKLTASMNELVSGGNKEEKLPGFATGGIATHPMVARLAEKEPEFIIPKSKVGSFVDSFAPGGGKEQRPISFNQTFQFGGEQPDAAKTADQFFNTMRRFERSGIRA